LAKAGKIQGMSSVKGFRGISDYVGNASLASAR
jgi:hypothetical protein